MSMTPPAQPVSPKSRVAAALLGFFLGGLGAPDFYLGHTKIGVIKLILTFVGSAMYVPGYTAYVNELLMGNLNATMSPVTLIGMLIMGVVGIWVLVTFIQILIRKGRYATDAKGQPLA